MASSPTRGTLPNPDERSRCPSYKASYQTYEEALDEAERLMELGRVSPGCHITPYQCDECGHWHNGNRVIIPWRQIRPPEIEE